jgi:hypothetical protein
LLKGTTVRLKSIKTIRIWYWRIALMMGAASASETSVNFYQTTQRYIPEDSHLLFLT